MSKLLRKGDRIVLILMPGDPAPIAPGTEGTVVGVHTSHGMTQLMVDWDNGRKLGVAIPPDSVKVIAKDS